MLPLFERYPSLVARISHVRLAVLPTPVEALTRLGSILGAAQLYVKRDDLSGETYGGNKVRKLELLLAAALEDNARAVLTFGAAGSNHALATTLYAKQLGLESISMLVPQHNAYAVRRNLLMGHHVGARLCLCPTVEAIAAAAREISSEHIKRYGRVPHVIPAGGSSPLGSISFVSAALELKKQVDAGDLPEPDALYVASGTMGTWVGLLLGLRVAGLKTRVEAIRVTGGEFTSEAGGRKLFHATNALLHEEDGAFPLVDFPERHFVLRDEFLGEEYALYTREGVEAVTRAKEEAGLKLEGSYTGKAFAAFLADAASGALDGKVALFWNTYNGRELDSGALSADYHALPVAAQAYFEEAVQPLDVE